MLRATTRKSKIALEMVRLSVLSELPGINTVGLEFAMSIADWPTSLERLKSVYQMQCPDNETTTPCQLSVLRTDPLNLALNKLSKQLETIELDGLIISPELFTSSEGKDGPYWQS